MDEQRPVNDSIGSTLQLGHHTSLIICSRNRPDMLVATISSILQSNDLPTELIIVDQSNVPQPDLERHQPDGTCEIRYMWSRSTGLCRANNIGVAAARYDLLIFSHDDVLVTPTWFGELVAALVAAGPQTVVTGRVLASEPERPGNFAPSLKVDEQPAVYEGRKFMGVIYPMNMAMHRSALEAIGGFDERLGPGTPLPAAEDKDLEYRLLEAGYRIAYIPEAMLYHRAWRNDHDFLPLRWSYGVGLGGFYAKHLSLRDRHILRHIAWDIKRRILRFPRRLWHERSLALGDPAFLLGNIYGAMLWHVLRRRTNRTSSVKSSMS